MIFSNSVFVFNLGFDHAAKKIVSLQAASSNDSLSSRAPKGRRAVQKSLNDGKPNNSLVHIQELLDAEYLLFLVLEFRFRTVRTAAL